VVKVLPVSFLTMHSDNTHMVCCLKVHLYHLVPIAWLYGHLYGKKGRLSGRRGETKSGNNNGNPQNQLFDPGFFLFTPSDSF